MKRIFRGLARWFGIAGVWMMLVSTAQAGIFPSPVNNSQPTLCNPTATLCLNLQNPVGTTVFSVDKNGVLKNTGNALIATNLYVDKTTGEASTYQGGFFGFSATPGTTSADLRLYRDAANTLALRNGTNAQCDQIANTWTDASNFEYGTLCWVSNEFRIGSTKLGTGTTRNIVINSNNGLYLGGGTAAGGSGSSASQWLVSTGGHFLAVTDNTNDIGQSGANRPRNVYVAGVVTSSGGTSTFTRVATLVHTVAGLTTCNSGSEGTRDAVSDATQTLAAGVGATVAGSGSNHVPVYCDGTSWKIGRADLSPANDNLPPELRKQAGELWSAFG